jgi:hypothetical protein
VITYFGLRLRVTYNLSAEFAQLQAEHRDMMALSNQRLQELRARLDEMERVLFGDVLAKIEKTQKTATPKLPIPDVWQRNRDRELRDRLDALEKWRLQQEAKGR